MPTTTFRDEAKQRLLLLEAFRADVWGNEFIFTQKIDRQSGSNLRTVEYLDFGSHLRAVQLLCRAVTHEKLVVFQEYRDAIDEFEKEDSDYWKGACILGQPGIGKMYHK